MRPVRVLSRRPHLSVLDMVRPWGTVLALLAGWGLSATAASAQSLFPHTSRSGPRTSPSPLEMVELRDNRQYRGYIESEDAAWLYMASIHRPNGRPMFLVIHPIERSLIKRIVRLDDQQRAVLRKQIDAFIHRAQIERGRMKAKELTLAQHEGRHFHSYRGKWFTLESNTDEPTTRRIVVRIEQVFTAFRQVLTPQAEPQRPLRILVFGSMDDYRNYLKQLGLNITSPACFIEDDNRIVAGCNLVTVADQLAKINARHDQLRAELEREQANLDALLADQGQRLAAQGVSRAEIARTLRSFGAQQQRVIEQKQRELNTLDRTNARVFDQATTEMFTRLYHEAFHAYLENYVFSSKTHDVPLWLNEGLATMLERGLLESETLRIDAPNSDALKRLKADLAAGRPLPLEEVLSGDSRRFLQNPDADLYYAYSWGLVYYLAFERDLLESAALREYVAPKAAAVAPIARFEKLIGEPLDAFETRWRAYILQLR